MAKIKFLLQSKSENAQIYIRVSIMTIPMKVDTLFRSKVDSCFADDFLG